MNEAPHSGRGRDPRDRARAIDMQRVEPLMTGLMQHGDGVDAAFGAVEGPRDRRLIANIGLNDLDLADVPEHGQTIAPPRVPDRDPDARATFGERPDDLAAHEPGAAENRH
jgi:hypothetical protein